MEIQNLVVMMELAEYIEQTNLKPDCTQEDITKMCEEALDYDFYGICVSPYFVQLAKKLLNKAPVKIITVVGFPLGYSTTSAKVEETKKAIVSGADEIDMVMNMAAFKSGDFATVLNDIEAVVTACHLKNTICKVIIETSYLNEEELEHAAKICADAGADFVKTSTGFSDKGATVENVSLLRRVLPPKMRIKASGGIRDLAFATQLIAAGASRIGTSSGVQLIQMYPKHV